MAAAGGVGATAGTAGGSSSSSSADSSHPQAQGAVRRVQIGSESVSMTEMQFKLYKNLTPAARSAYHEQFLKAQADAQAEVAASVGRARASAGSRAGGSRAGGSSSSSRAGDGAAGRAPENPPSLIALGHQAELGVPIYCGPLPTVSDVLPTRPVTRSQSTSKVEGQVVRRSKRVAKVEGQAVRRSKRVKQQR